MKIWSDDSHGTREGHEKVFYILWYYFYGGLGKRIFGLKKSNVKVQSVFFGGQKFYKAIQDSKKK